MIHAGIDAGSRTIKGVLLDSETSGIVASGILDQGIEQEALARQLFDDLLREAGANQEQVSRIVATGYGRHRLGFANEAITEISCHAAGVRRLVPGVRTIIDIGGQDSKLIRLDDNGTVQDFVMNDRCAAGTGCFLEVVARRLDLTLEELGEAAAGSGDPADISGMCVVFAETEIVGLLATGTAMEDIVAGVQKAIAGRVSSMGGRATEDPVVFTGGVALIPGMKAALESSVGRDVKISPDPQMTGALGAAILGGRREGGG